MLRVSWYFIETRQYINFKTIRSNLLILIVVPVKNWQQKINCFRNIMKLFCMFNNLRLKIKLMVRNCIFVYLYISVKNIIFILIILILVLPISTINMWWSNKDKVTLLTKYLWITHTKAAGQQRSMLVLIFCFPVLHSYWICIVIK